MTSPIFCFPQPDVFLWMTKFLSVCTFVYNQTRSLCTECGDTVLAWWWAMCTYYMLNPVHVLVCVSSSCVSPENWDHVTTGCLKGNFIFVLFYNLFGGRTCLFFIISCTCLLVQVKILCVFNILLLAKKSQAVLDALKSCSFVKWGKWEKGNNIKAGNRISQIRFWALHPKDWFGAYLNKEDSTML